MKILLVVDLTKNQAKNYIEFYKDALNFIEDNKNFYNKIISVRWINDVGSPFEKYLNYYENKQIEKLEFKCDENYLRHGYGLLSYDMLNKDDDIDIIGFNIESSILKIALDLFDKDFKFRVLSKYCFSNNGKQMKKLGLEILKNNIGSLLVE